jgi:hypothetical protein
MRDTALVKVSEVSTAISGTDTGLGCGGGVAVSPDWG